MFVLISIGTMGFILIADYNFINALYMTVITVSTVGFKEVEPLDFQSKLFTSQALIKELNYIDLIGRNILVPNSTLSKNSHPS